MHNGNKSLVEITHEYYANCTIASPNNIIIMHNYRTDLCWYSKQRVDCIQDDGGLLLFKWVN